MKKVCRLFIAAVLVVIGHAGLFATSSLAEDYPDRASNPLEADAKPAIGNIAGIKLSIPHHYMPRGVHYKGEPVWRRERTPNPSRTFESEIEDFGLLLRQSNYQPVQTPKDRLDYLAFVRAFSSPADNRWLVLDIEPARYVGSSGTLQHMFNNYMKELTEIVHWGPFISQEGEVYGLKRAVSSKPEKDKSSVEEVDEFFYDPNTWGTFITCSNNHQKVPPFAPFSSCDHYFTVPEVKSVARVWFAKEDLSRWSETEREVKKVISSFIVK